MKKYCFILFLLIIIPMNVFANVICNDGTVSPTCSVCSRGCCSRHGGCSGATTNPSGGGSTGIVATPAPTPVPVIKSSDTSLKEVLLDSTPLDIKDIMEVDFAKENATLSVTPNDNKATVQYESNLTLIDGENTIIIIVTAENGNQKEYQIVIHNQLLSDNKNFKIYYKDKDLSIHKDNYTIDNITVDSNITSVTFTYKVEDKNTKIEFKDNKDLDYGDNIVTVVVTAEDKSYEEYKLIVNRKKNIKEKEKKDNVNVEIIDDKAETNNNLLNTIYTITGFSLLGGASTLGIMKAKKKR